MAVRHHGLSYTRAACAARAKPGKRSGLTAFFDADLGFGFGAFDVATCGQPLVAQDAQRFHFRALAGALAVFQHLEVAGTRHAVFGDGFFFGDVGLRPPQHQQFSDVLDGGGAELVCQCLEHGFARHPVIRENTNFDQAMGVECAIDFFFDIGGQAVIAHHHDRVQVVRIGTVNFALGGGQLNMGHTAIIGAMKKTSSASDPASSGSAAKPAAKGKKVNKAWLHDHINDPYVKLATREGYRARAAYKLKEIDETFGLVKPGQLVVDLGCTPGAWSQYLRRRMSPQGAAVGAMNGTIIGLDLLPMEAIEGVHFIQGDFREAEVLAQLEAALGGQQADLVVSDMAPNLSGISSADAARIEYLVELAIEFAQNHMKPEGALVAKVFHGGSYNDVVQHFKAAFRTVKPFKPKASRDRSSETFLVGLGLK